VGLLLLSAHVLPHLLAIKPVPSSRIQNKLSVEESQVGTVCARGTAVCTVLAFA